MILTEKIESLPERFRNFAVQVFDMMSIFDWTRVNSFLRQDVDGVKHW